MRRTTTAVMCAVLVASVAGTASAEQAVVVVGREESPPPVEERPPERPEERLDSSLRLHVGPVAATTGRGSDPGWVWRPTSDGGQSASGSTQTGRAASR